MRDRLAVLCFILAATIGFQRPILAQASSLTMETTVPAHLDYFPSRLHAVIYRNWEIVPTADLAAVLQTSVPKVLETGRSLGLTAPQPISPEFKKRNHETVLRRNWPLLPRHQIEELLHWKPEDLDRFLATDIAFRVLLGNPPPDLQPLHYSEPTPETQRRAQWFALQLKKHSAAAGDVAVDPRFNFINTMSQPFNPADHIPGTLPPPNSADLRQPWTILVTPEAGPVTRQYVSDFSNYCAQIHKAPRPTITTGSVSAAPTENTISITIAPQPGPDESYTLDITTGSINITAPTDRGISRALLELERRMAEQGGPYLPSTTGTLTMKPAFSPRYVYPYFAPMTDVLGQDIIDPAPDGYLAQVARQDAEGIWMFCVLTDLVNSQQFPELSKDTEARRHRLREIVARAGKYGLKVYLYFNEPRPQPLPFFEKHQAIKGRTEGNLAAMCTSTDEVRQHIKSSFETLFREVPGLGGTFIITASENLTHCYAHGLKIDCPRCSKRRPEDVIAELARATADGVHAAAPDAPVIVWDWSWHSVGIADPQQDIINALKPDMSLMADFERGTPIHRGGVPMTVDEYSLSVIGPSPRAELRGKQARDVGIPFLAKVNLSNTWECGTLPFIPVPGLVAAKADAMSTAGVTGAMLSWTLGSCPSPNTDAFAVKQWNPDLTTTEVLQRVAQRRYGQSAAATAVRAWTGFGEVFSREYPYSAAIYNGPIQYAPGLPWYRNTIPKPYGHGAMLNPKDDWKIWTAPYNASQMAVQLRKMCKQWSGSLADFKAIIGEAPDSRKPTAELDYGVAWILDYTFKSFANTLDFYQARDAGNTSEMQRLAKEELTATTEAYRYVLKDSRLGWEAQLQYYYQPSDVLEKLVSLEAVLSEPGM